MLIPDPELFLKYLAQKDNKAFQHLYGMYFSALKALAVNYVKDEDEAEDLVQEVFITLLESNHRFQSVDEVKYFLYNILKNKCISHYRKQKVRDRYRQEMQDAEEPREDFWAKVLEEDVYAHLMAAIEVLPPRDEMLPGRAQDCRDSRPAPHLGRDSQRTQTKRETQAGEDVRQPVPGSCDIFLVKSYFLTPLFY